MIPVVAIGTSAGGLKEIETFFKNMPKSKKVAFVIIQHLSPHSKSILAEIVTRYTKMDVSQITRKTIIKAGKIYIIPPNKLLSLNEGRLVLSPLATNKSINLPIDIFFRSMKHSQGEKAVAVILSGTGSDGTVGIKEVKEGGGLCLVQEPDTAEYDGMPINAIKTGLIDYVVPVEKMPSLIIDYVENNFHHNQILKEDDKNSELFINQIFQIIQNQTGNDFSQYKRNTINRRIERRLTVNKSKDLASYLQFLKDHNSEIFALSKELLISVTNFFRDKDVFEKMHNEVIPKLVKNCNGENLRVWVPACATGEEAFTLAILVKDYLEKNKLNIDLQVFASDVDADAIETAREGFYTNNIAADIDAGLLNKYFTKERDGFRVKKSLRELVIFAEQNVLQDPPYSKIDLISCRNLLIYFNTDLQNKAISVFNYALNENGVLLLGNSESLGTFANYFDVIDRKLKIYRKATNIDLRGKVWNLNFHSGYHKGSSEKELLEPVPTIAQNFLLEYYTPPSVVVDYSGNMIYVQGRTGKYLENTTGVVSHDIIRNAREGIKIPLSNAIRKSKASNTEIIQKDIRIKTNEGYEFIDLCVSPLKRQNKDTNLLLVVFKAVENESKASFSKSDDKFENTELIDLERELAEKEQYLQNTIEELETTNEELKSSNEEAQSTNEELQSANEELETSKEELQSVNEELTTTNNELNHKLDELYKSNNDLENLLDATSIATIFLDKDLKIFNFTPSVSSIIELLKSDTGRSIKQFTNKLKYNYLVEDARSVLKKLVPVETEVENLAGDVFWMRITPYRTTDDKIEGLVITFTDITEKKKQEAELEKYRHHLEELVEEKSSELKDSEQKFRTLYDNAPLSYQSLDEDGYIMDINPTWLKVLGYTKDEVVGKWFGDFLSPEYIDQFRKNFSKFKKHGNVSGVQFQLRKKDNEYIDVSYEGCIGYTPDGKFKQTYCVFKDVTQQKLAEKELQSQRDMFETVINSVPARIFWKDKNSVYLGCNPNFLIDAGVKSKKDVIGQKDESFVWGKDADSYRKDDREIMERGIARLHFEEPFIGINGDKIVWETNKLPLKNNKGEIIGVLATSENITERKKIENELLKNQHYLQKAQELGAIGTWHLDIENNILTWTEENYKIFGIKNKTPLNYDLFLNCIHPDDRDYVDKEWKKGIANHAYDIEHRLIVNGKVKWVREKAEFSPNNKGEVLEAFGVTQDITEKKHTEKELVLARIKAEENDRLKSTFLSNMSHEIRTPMNGLLGFADLLREENLENKIRNQYIDIIEKQSNRLLLLIDDILDISKIESGQLKMCEKSCSLRNILEQLELTFNQVKKSKHKEHIRIVSKLPQQHQNIVIKCDPYRLQQVFSNLIGNALKFSDQGSIEFGFNIKEKMIQFYVKDQGIGIPKDKLALVFKRFEQIGSLGHEFSEGTGLGLAISKGIIELLNGKIEVESEVDTGTTFTFYIPLIHGDENELGKEKQVKVDSKFFIGKKMLIVEDELINIELFKAIFDSNLPNILFAKNGVEAIQMAKENSDVGVILMDLRMPVMDGYEATKHILEANPKTKIIAQTAFAKVQDEIDCLNQGFVDYISKPINKDVLFEKLAKWI